ncbi:MAG: DUF420 domain-containing protein [Saprospiraceae bacterium]|nr:DUF420 domain-containing protein [Saprospiraceae bacterium]
MEKGNIKLGKKLDRVAGVLSIIIFLLVGLMRRVKIDLAINSSVLPPVNAILNTFTTLFLLGALYMVIRKNYDAHMKFMTAALISSVLFLLCYVLYHFTTVETSFCREGWIRTFYYVILLTHIVLAGLSLPFILFTYIRAYTKQFDKHKSLARKVYPVWLYVSITGPVVYLLLKPCYGL